MKTLVLAALAAATPAMAQLSWRRDPWLVARSSFGLVTDSVRGRVVLHGGVDARYQALRDTWEWAGGQWQLRRPPAPPKIHPAGALTFDRKRKSVVAFPSGGRLDPWAFDGQRWRALSVAGAPSSGWAPAVASDETRGELVVYVRKPPRAETWALTGSAWQRRWSGNALQQVPHWHRAAWCGRISRVVLVSRDRSWTMLTAVWDGKAWQKLASGTPPLLAIAPDPATGGVVGVGRKDMRDVQVFRFDGVRWRRSGPTLAAPGEQLGIAKLGGLLLVAIGDARSTLVRTWLLAGGKWLEIVTPRPDPDTYSWLQVAHDPVNDRDVVLAERSSAGPTETWIHDASGLRKATNRTAPAGTGGGLVWHAGLASVLLVRPSPHGLWRFQAGDWSRIANGPPVKWPSRPAYDRRRDRIVVGDGGAGTWEWDRKGWNVVRSANTPHYNHCAYDPVRVVVVARVLKDLWEWNGRSWQKRTSKTTPEGYDGVLVPAPELGGVLLAGAWRYRSYRIRELTRRTWLWDGRDWRELAVGLYDQAAGFDVRAVVRDAGRQEIRAYSSDSRVFSLRARPLTAEMLDLRPGNTLRTTIEWPPQANHLFVLSLAASSHPAIPLLRNAFGEPVLLPLSLDALLVASLGFGLATTLDNVGRGKVALPIPNAPQLAGARFFAAGWTLAPTGFQGTTNALRVDIVR